jgi:hypothetical protein
MAYHLRTSSSHVEVNYSRHGRYARTLTTFLGRHRKLQLSVVVVMLSDLSVGHTRA